MVGVVDTKVGDSRSVVEEAEAFREELARAGFFDEDEEEGEEPGDDGCYVEYPSPVKHC